MNGLTKQINTTATYSFKNDKTKKSAWKDTTISVMDFVYEQGKCKVDRIFSDVKKTSLSYDRTFCSKVAPLINKMTAQCSIAIAKIFHAIDDLNDYAKKNKMTLVPSYFSSQLESDRSPFAAAIQMCAPDMGAKASVITNDLLDEQHYANPRVEDYKEAPAGK